MEPGDGAAQSGLLPHLMGGGAERDELQRKLAEGDQAFDRRVERLERGVIDEEQFARLNTAHREEKAPLCTRLAGLEQEAERTVDLETLVGQVEATLQDFPSNWEALTTDERRGVLRSLVEYLDVYGDEMELKLLFSPPVRLSLGGRRGRKEKARR